MRLCWRTQKTSQTFRQKRPPWRMHSVQVRFRWHCTGPRLMRCSHPLKESRSLTPEDDGCLGGIAPVVARRGVPGKSSVRGKDKTSCHSKHPQARKTAKPRRFPTTKLRFAICWGEPPMCTHMLARPFLTEGSIQRLRKHTPMAGTSAVPAPHVLQIAERFTVPNKSRLVDQVQFSQCTHQRFRCTGLRQGNLAELIDAHAGSHRDCCDVHNRRCMIAYHQATQ